tara:strand:- start:1663 stop:3000 length:1338 start_codon:yes stop_codon:yes gene_type:complete
MERVAPSQVNYDDQLPIAISSKSRRREFFPEGGSVYGPNGGSNPNIIRIPVNADSMLDVQNSYIKFDLVTAVKTAGLDLPQSFIKRVRILSGGTVLEDIDQYGRLYAGILYPAQATRANWKGEGLRTGQVSHVAAAQPLLINSLRMPDDTTLAVGTHVGYCIHLATGLLNLDKYVPLVMMNAGFTIELELDVNGSIGVWATDATGTWELHNPRYVAHLIDLERDFYDRLRMVMEGSGGVLQLAGQTYRHYSGQVPSGATNTTINVPARVKSIKSIFFKHTLESAINAFDAYGISSSMTHGATEFQFRVGSVVYPPQPVKCSTGVSSTNIALGRGESYNELEKAFGNLSSHDSGSELLDAMTYCRDATSAAGATNSAILSPYGLDFESFNRSAIENGVNSADRSLPISLDIKMTAQTIVGGTTCDVYCLCDAIFYINLDGTVSVSV